MFQQPNSSRSSALLLNSSSHLHSWRISLEAGTGECGGCPVLLWQCCWCTAGHSQCTQPSHRAGLPAPAHRGTHWRGCAAPLRHLGGSGSILLQDTHHVGMKWMGKYEEN